MNIPKAIEILDLYQADLRYDPEIDLVTAIKLLIEAGKEIAHFRSLYMPGICPKLPGETKD